MPANYPRTENRKYRRGQRKITESNEQKLDRISATIGGDGSSGYSCKSKGSAESLAAALNSQYRITSGSNAYYTAVSNPPRVIYVENPDPESITERVNGFEITTYKNFCTDGWEKSLEEKPFRYTINKNGEHEFDNLRDYKLARDIAVKYNDKILDNMTHSRNYSKNPQDLLPPEIQEIDSYQTSHRHDTETGNDTKLNLRYRNFAFMQRKSSGNNIPHYDSFKKRPDLRRAKQKDIITQYKQFTENHERAIEASFKSKLKLDFQSYCKDPVKNMDLFSDRGSVDVFEKGYKGIGVKSKYLNGVTFVDKDNPEINNAFGNFCLAYHKPTKKILIRNDVSSDFVENGGLYHELMHAQIEQEYEKDFKSLEEQFGFSRWGESKNEGIEAIVQSFEEVAAHVKTFDFMGKDEKYAKQVYDTYRMNPYDKRDVTMFVADCLRGENKTGHIELAEAIATINYFDENAGNNIKEHLKGWGDNIQIKSALRLAGTFSEAHGYNGFSLKPLFNLFGNKKRGNG